MNTAFALEWLGEQGLGKLPDLLGALAIGLLIGLERERNPGARAGLRTFALVALFGAVTAVLAETLASPALIAVGAGAVALMIIAAYLRQDAPSDDPGTTTVIALLLCYALAALAVSGSARLAVMLAIAVLVLLYFKAELHGIARGLERRDLLSILQFAVLTFVVLPILPDRDLGPYGAFNPREIWLMVVLVSGISLAGYVALRLVGGRYGAALLGLLGGLVSSTATTLAYSRQGSQPALWNLSATVIVMANTMVLLRLAAVSAIVAPELAVGFAPVLACGLLPGVIAVLYWLRRLEREQVLTMPEIRNPAEIRTALAFGLLYALVLLVAAWLNHMAGSRGLYVVALVSGLTDVDALTLSSLRLFNLQQLTESAAMIGIVLAVLSNIGFKLSMVAIAGGRGLFLRCLPGMGAVGIGAAIGAALLT